MEEFRLIDVLKNSLVYLYVSSRCFQDFLKASAEIDTFSSFIVYVSNCLCNIICQEHRPTSRTVIPPKATTPQPNVLSYQQHHNIAPDMPIAHTPWQQSDEAKGQ